MDIQFRVERAFAIQFSFEDLVKTKGLEDIVKDLEKITVQDLLNEIEAKKGALVSPTSN